jgi:hypothetical protein
MVKPFKSRGDKANQMHRGFNLSTMKSYLLKSKGKVVSIDELRKFVDSLPSVDKKAKGGMAKKKMAKGGVAKKK